LTPRDLYFASHHQAAHVVTAITLGCEVHYVDIGLPMEEVGWSLDTASVSDIEAVCAAGFEMERLLGRLYDQAWARSQEDRNLLASLYSDRTGLTMDQATLTERFLAGATSCRSILDHQTSRNAIDLVADALSTLLESGLHRLSAEAIYSITGNALRSVSPALPA